MIEVSKKAVDLDPSYYQERADCMPWIRSDPKLDRLRGDPQFEDLLRRMGVPR